MNQTLCSTISSLLWSNCLSIDWKSLNSSEQIISIVWTDPMARFNVIQVASNLIWVLKMLSCSSAKKRRNDSRIEVSFTIESMSLAFRLHWLIYLRRAVMITKHCLSERYLLVTWILIRYYKYSGTVRPSDVLGAMFCKVWLKSSSSIRSLECCLAWAISLNRFAFRISCFFFFRNEIANSSLFLRGSVSFY